MSKQSSLKELARAVLHELYRSKGLYKIVAVVILAAMLFFSVFYEEQYSSTLRLKSSRSADDAQNASVVFNTLYEKVINRDFLNQVIDSLDNVHASELRNAGVAVFEQSLFIEQNSLGGIDVRVVSNDAKKSFYIAEAIETQLFNEPSLDIDIAAIETKLQSHEEDIKHIEDKIAVSKAKLENFQSASLKTDVIKIANKVSRLEEKLDTVDVDLGVINTKLSAYRDQFAVEEELQHVLQEYQAVQSEADRLDQHQRSVSDQLDDVHNRLYQQQSLPRKKRDRPFMEVLEGDIVRLEAELASLKQSYNAKLEELVVLKQNKKLATVLNNPTQSSSLYEQLREKITLLEADKKGLESKRASLDNLLQEGTKSKQIGFSEISSFEEIERSIAQSQEELSRLKQEKFRTIASKVQLEKQKFAYVVVESPSKPNTYDGVGSREFLLYGPFVAILLPLTLAFFLVVFDARIRTSHELARVLPTSVPVLEVVPHFNSPMGVRIVRNTIVGMLIWGLVVSCGYVFLGYVGLYVA